jgi:hypothetical protein
MAHVELKKSHSRPAKRSVKSRGNGSVHSSVTHLIRFTHPSAYPFSFLMREVISSHPRRCSAQPEYDNFAFGRQRNRSLVSLQVFRSGFLTKCYSEQLAFGNTVEDLATYSPDIGGTAMMRSAGIVS